MLVELYGEVGLVAGHGKREEIDAIRKAFEESDNVVTARHGKTLVGAGRKEIAMGLWDKIREQFVDVIEWMDTSRETIVYRFPHRNNEIKIGAQLIVRESRPRSSSTPASWATSSSPAGTSWSPRTSPCSPRSRAGNTPSTLPSRWGTANPVMFRDPEFGPLRLRDFGSFCFRCTDAGRFIRRIVGTDCLFETDEIHGQLSNLLISRFADALGESRIPALDLAANYKSVAYEEGICS